MRALRALTLSAGFHILVVLLLWTLPPAERLNPRQTTVVELVEQPELPRRPKQVPADEKQFVRAAPAPEKLLTTEERERRFASESDQTVLQEQRARETGMTKNRASQASNGQRAQNLRRSQPRTTAQRRDLNFAPSTPLERARKQMLADPNGEGVRVGGLQKNANRKPASAPAPLLAPNDVGQEQGLSTMGELVPPDVRFGDFTALNTDRHLFYSFYSRMEEMIRNRWETYARAAFFGLSYDARARLDKDLWTTRLEVVLDRDGTFQKAVLQESSGLRSLDAAPVQAFREASKFPNPPGEMVKDDGTIRIQYQFSVSLSPNAGSQN